MIHITVIRVHTSYLGDILRFLHGIISVKIDPIFEIKSNQIVFLYFCQQIKFIC